MSAGKTKIPGWLPGALVSLALVAGILYFVDLRATAAAIVRANYALLAAGLALSVLWLLVRAQVWRTLLRDKPSFPTTFLTIGEGYLLNNFLPFRLGELGRAFLLSRKSDLRFMEILPTVVIERVFDLAYTAAIFVLAVPFVVGAQGADRIGFIIGGVVLGGLVLLYIVARNRQQALNLFHTLSARWPVIQRLGGRFLESFFVGLAIFTDGWLFARFFLWMTFNWAIAIVQYTLVIQAFFPQATPIWGMFGLGAAAFGGAIPSLPGAVGTFEGAFGGALTLLSGDQSTALAVALTGRLYNYFTSGIVGAYALSREGQTLSGIYHQLMNLRNRQDDIL